MITITEDEPYTVHYHTRTIEFDGAAPVLLERRYSHGGKEFMPDRAFAKWSHGDAIDQINVSGYVLKKDRTSGQQRADLSYLTPANRLYEKYGYPSAPEWLLELFAASPHTTEATK
jgi:hypothetical protein